MLAWEVWEAGSQPAPRHGRGGGAQRGGWRIQGWSCCWRSSVASLGLLRTDSPKLPPPRPHGTPRSNTGWKRGPGAALAGFVPPLSIPLPGLPPSLGHWAGIALRVRLPSPLPRRSAAPTVRPKVCRPQAFLTASPSHPLRLPRLPFTGAALLAPGRGACAWVETASRWSYFFTFLGGRGGRFGKKPPGPRKQKERADFKGWFSTVWFPWDAPGSRVGGWKGN